VTACRTGAHLGLNILNISLGNSTSEKADKYNGMVKILHQSKQKKQLEISFLQQGISLPKTEV